MKMTDKQFDILIGVLYILPIPVLWLLFPPASLAMGGFYVGVTLVGLVQGYASFKSAYGTTRGGKG